MRTIHRDDMPPVKYNKNRCQLPGHDEFHAHGNGTFHCAECCRRRGRENAKRQHDEMRNAALDAYGGVCSCCGETERVFLAIDHIDGDGARQRSEFKGGGSFKIYRWLFINKYPAGYQVLCHNCNYAKHVLGTCPHKEVIP